MNIQWDFEKGLLAATVVLILAALGMKWWWGSEAEDLQKKMRPAERQLAEIGMWIREINELELAIANDPRASGTQGFEYLEDQMVQSNIGKKFRISTRDGDENSTYKDEVYEMRPVESRQTFTREQIGRFLLHVEMYTTRMRVTELRMDLARGRDAGPESWKPLIEVTDRTSAVTE